MEDEVCPKDWKKKIQDAGDFLPKSLIRISKITLKQENNLFEIKLVKGKIKLSRSSF